MDYLKGFFGELLNIIAEMSPYLLLGFLFAGILYLLFPKKKIRKYMGRNRRGAVVNASLLGIPLPLCSCGVIPTGLSFYRNGASKGSTVSFLISTPQTGVDSILVTYSLLGLPFALIRPVVALFTGIAGGFITNKIDKTDIITEEEEKGNGLPSGFFPRIREMFRYAFVEFLQDISGWLVAGLGIAALISVLVPDNFFAGVAGNDLVEMLIILVAAIPVYICATASVPIAAVLMLKGLSPGAALVLLMAGPATNAATITMITRVMGRKALMSYLFSISLGALIFGLIINRLLPASWFAVDRIMGHAGHEHQILPDWLMYSSAVLLVLLIINGYIQKWLKAGKQEKDYKLKASDMSNIHKIKVEGMTCNHCKSNVESALSSLEGIRSASADIRSGDVVIDADSIDERLVREKIESIGYKVL
ncbi:MAG: permease [Marinilabiliaceae bacterium]|jgi:uncharacterized membrane protein YraQ (UPF0718 family)/copper chaperone CopZ|nr:permease [Marinilabiliaceae bacterium]